MYAKPIVWRVNKFVGAGAVILWGCIGIMIVMTAPSSESNVASSTEATTTIAVKKDRLDVMGRAIRTDFIAGTDHRFNIPVLIDGITVNMLYDTGATQVFISRYSAERLGIDTTVECSVWFDSVNGNMCGVPLRIKKIAVGPIKVDDVEGFMILSPWFKTDLLGGTFIERVKATIIGKRLTFEQ